MEPPIKTHYVETLQDLEKCVDAVKKHTILVLDTEFRRKNTYYPELCLVQIATDADVYVIDAIALGSNLFPLESVLFDQGILKVLHSARQDLEILYNFFHKVPSPVFDTQIAAMVCGYGESVGFENIAKELLKLNIDKSMQNTDWTIRPLTEEHLNYAVGDVEILYRIYTTLQEKLKALGREDWVDEEFTNIVDERLYSTNSEYAWKRLKVRSNKQTYLKMLVSVARWREDYAKTHNVPRTWVLSDDAVYQIALILPKSLQKLEKILGKSVQVKIDVGELFEYVHQTQQNFDSMPEIELPTKLVASPQSIDAIELLKIFRSIQAGQLKIPAKFLASNNDIIRLVEGLPHKMIPWRQKEFCDRALKLLSGEIAIGIKDKKYFIC